MNPLQSLRRSKTISKDDSPRKHEIIAGSLIKRKNPPRAPAERVRTPTTVSESRRHLER